MKAKVHIEIDFQLTIREAERLEEAAAKLMGSQGHLGQITDCFYNTWSGANARIYMQKQDRLRKEILETRKEILRIASDIRAMAKRIYDAEMRAYEIACRRINGNYSSGEGYGGGFSGGGGGGFGGGVYGGR